VASVSVCVSVLAASARHYQAGATGSMVVRVMSRCLPVSPSQIESVIVCMATAIALGSHTAFDSHAASISQMGHSS
jgi:hypothetical protein